MMRYFLIAVLITAIIVLPSYAEINAKAGLAGGSARLAVEAARLIREDINGLASIGYGYNSGYSLLSAELSVTKPFPNQLEIGLGVTYSSYSTLVQNLVGAGTVNEKAGVGGQLFVRKPIRDNIFAQLGYDTRMGLIAEAVYCLRK